MQPNLFLLTLPTEVTTSLLLLQQTKASKIRFWHMLDMHSPIMRYMLNSFLTPTGSTKCPFNFSGYIYTTKTVKYSEI